MTTGFKLLRLRRDGTLGPLFIGRNIVVEPGRWMRARAIRTPGFKFRPGWHACAKPLAPHLSKTGRVWCRVSLRGVTKYNKPQHQGGLWFTAKYLRIEEVIG